MKSILFSTLLTFYNFNNICLQLKTNISNSILITSKKADEKSDIKDAAISFFKWYENVWDTRMTARNISSYRIILNKAGKPEEDEGNGCPCTIDWNEANKFMSWAHSIGPLISNNYLTLSKNAIIKAESKFKKAKNKQDDIEAVEALFIDGRFHFFPGNGGEPKFSESGIYSSNAIWDINIDPNGLAIVNVTFQMPSGWHDKVKAYKMTMIKEDNNWKLASKILEGTINTGFHQ